MENVIVVDNLPVVPPEKVEKLIGTYVSEMNAFCLLSFSDMHLMVLCGIHGCEETVHIEFNNMVDAALQSAFS